MPIKLLSTGQSTRWPLQIFWSTWSSSFRSGYFPCILPGGGGSKCRPILHIVCKSQSAILSGQLQFLASACKWWGLETSWIRHRQFRQVLLRKVLLVLCPASEIALCTRMIKSSWKPWLLIEIHTDTLRISIPIPGFNCVSQEVGIDVPNNLSG